jgi:hypothetical protein
MEMEAKFTLALFITVSSKEDEFPIKEEVRLT